MEITIIYNKMDRKRYSHKKRKKSINKKKRSNDSDSSSESDNESDNEIYEKGNHIWFNTSVTKNTTNKLVRMIHNKNIKYNKNVHKLSHMADLQPKPIYIHINSYGGDLLAVMAVIDAIKNSKIPVHTIVEGVAASAGTLMSVVGHHRSITENSYMLIHQLSTGMYGKMEELEEEMVNNKVFMKRIKDIYYNHSKLGKSEITNALKHDLWWDAKTCLKKGLVDSIIMPDG